ncbi:MAG: hypothetical protein CfClM3_1355 [Methanobrevibacter sp. CfCl-M3]
MFNYLKVVGCFIIFLFIFSSCNYAINPGDAYNTNKKVVSMAEVEKCTDTIMGSNLPNEAKAYLTYTSLVHDNETLLAGDVYYYFWSKINDDLMALPPAIRTYSISYVTNYFKKSPVGQQSGTTQNDILTGVKTLTGEEMFVFVDLYGKLLKLNFMGND